MVKKFLDYLKSCRIGLAKFYVKNSVMFFEALEQSPNCRKENLTKEFDNYLCELIVLGYDSSNYDLNLIKPKLIERLVKKIGFVIKKANNYLCIKTNKLRFLVIRHFLAPGFSNAKFLKAYHFEGEKFYFRFEYINYLFGNLGRRSVTALLCFLQFS